MCYFYAVDSEESFLRNAPTASKRSNVSTRMSAVPSPHTPGSPLSPIAFERGGMVKKRFRRPSGLAKRALLQQQQGGAENAGPNGAGGPSADGTAKPPPQPPAAGTWWDDKRDHFLHWLRCNPLRLGIGADSVTFIKAQLKRGDENVSRRATCWRHVVVELLSTGVPGLDADLLSTAEIPAEAQRVDLSAVLDTVPTTLDGKAATVEALEAAGTTDAALRSEVVRLASERAALLQRMQQNDQEMREAMEARADSDKALRAGTERLQASEARVAELEAHVKQLCASVKSAKNAAASTASADGAAAAGSGVAAVKALATASSCPSSAEDNNKTKAAAPAVNLRAMSMLERQEHMLQQRKLKREEALRLKQQQEDAEEQRGRDERAAAAKLRASKWDHVRSRLHDVVKTGEKSSSEVSSRRKSNTSAAGGSGSGSGSATSVGSKWGKVRGSIKAAAAFKSGAKKQRRSSKPRRSSAAKDKDAKPSLLDMCKSMLGDKAKDATGKTAENEGVTGVSKPADIATGALREEEDLADPPPTPTPNQTPGRAMALPPAVVAEAEKATVADEETEAPAPADAVPALTPHEGFFCKTGTNAIKGKHVIQDAMPFNIDTFFRKRDKNAGADGVSLLMARRDDNHGTVEAIAVFFDRTKFTEEKAAEWWVHNRCRFPNAID